MIIHSTSNPWATLYETFRIQSNPVPNWAKLTVCDFNNPTLWGMDDVKFITYPSQAIHIGSDFRKAARIFLDLVSRYQSKNQAAWENRMDRESFQTDRDDDLSPFVHCLINLSLSPVPHVDWEWVEGDSFGFRINHGKLDMKVVSRTQDIIRQLTLETCVYAFIQTLAVSILKLSGTYVEAGIIVNHVGRLTVLEEGYHLLFMAARGPYIEQPYWNELLACLDYGFSDVDIMNLLSGLSYPPSQLLHLLREIAR